MCVVRGRMYVVIIIIDLFRHYVRQLRIARWIFLIHTVFVFPYF